MSRKLKIHRWRQRTGSSPVTGTKIKGNCFRSCLLFWVPAAEGGLHPSVFECSGRRSRPSAKVFAYGKNACTAHSRRGPEGPLGDSPTTVPSIQNIDFYRPFQNERSFFRMSFHFGFRPPKAASTLRYLNAQGGGAALPPRFLPTAKTLVRRTRAAAQKGRRALLGSPF